MCGSLRSRGAAKLQRDRAAHLRLLITHSHTLLSDIYEQNLVQTQSNLPSSHLFLITALNLDQTYFTLMCKLLFVTVSRFKAASDQNRINRY